jgi:hypothetical protein
MAENKRNEEASARLAELLIRKFEGNWTTPDGWPGEADSSLIDSVFSTQAKYESVVRPLVNRFRESAIRDPKGSLATLASVSSKGLMDVICNKQLVPGRSPNRLLKVDAVRVVATELVSRNWSTPAQILDAATTFPADFRSAFVKTSGVGQAQYSYFLMLLGITGVKPDTLVTAWVERELELSSVSQKDIQRIVIEAARKIGVDATTVDHTIWSEESKARGVGGRRRG